MSAVKKKVAPKRKPARKKLAPKTAKTEKKPHIPPVVEDGIQGLSESELGEVEAKSEVDQAINTAIDLSDALEPEAVTVEGSSPEDSEKDNTIEVDLDLAGVNAVDLGIGMAEGLIAAAAGEQWIPTPEEKAQLKKIIDALMAKHGVGTADVSPEAALVMFGASYAASRILPMMMANVQIEDDSGSDAGGKDGD